MFRYRERMLSSVIRWSVLPRHHNQSVAEHSFFVALYTDQLTHLMKWPSEKRYLAISWALRHDMGEVVVGDIMGPVKRIIVDANKLADLEKQTLEAIGNYYSLNPPTDQMRMVVKAANCIDEFFWLSAELVMGNQSVREMQNIVAARMTKALKRIDLGHLTGDLWAEYDNMRHGLGFPQKDNDLDE